MFWTHLSLWTILGIGGEGAVPFSPEHHHKDVIFSCFMNSALSCIAWSRILELLAGRVGWYGQILSLLYVFLNFWSDQTMCAFKSHVFSLICGI
jgi:hypothetical protein